MRALFCVLALVLSVPAFAQEEKPPAKKPVAKKQQPAALKPKAHSKPTPEQVRRFSELEKQHKTQ
ncbi:MAG TPA: hypothetical protein VFR66_09275 [Burkholderiales bacterium]|nr:hypothetical protein [Burkholderiales bacterium]